MATTISVSETTKRMLDFFGHKHETYDQIIRKLIKYVDKEKLKKAFIEEQKKILETEEFTKVDDL